jgi:hypothetical protein
MAGNGFGQQNIIGPRFVPLARWVAARGEKIGGDEWLF